MSSLSTNARTLQPERNEVVVDFRPHKIGSKGFIRLPFSEFDVRLGIVRCVPLLVPTRQVRIKKNMDHDTEMIKIMFSP